MKLNKRETNRAPLGKSIEVLNAPEDEPSIFKLGDFFIPEEWATIDRIILEKLINRKDEREGLENFLLAVVGLFLLDPKKIQTIRSNEMAKDRSRVLRSEDAKFLSPLKWLELGAFGYWLFPDLKVELQPKLLELNRLGSSASIESEAVSLFVDQARLPDLTIRKEWVKDVERVGFQMEQNPLEDHFIATHLLTIASLFRDLLPDTKRLLARAQKVQQDNRSHRQLTNVGAGVNSHALTVKMIDAAFVRATFAEKIEFTDQGIIIQDRKTSLGQSKPLPVRNTL